MKLKKNLMLAISLFVSGMAFGQSADAIAHKRLPLKVVAVGNSITEGYGNSSAEAAWPGQLAKLLGSNFSVLNCGVSGTTMSREAEATYWKTDRYAKAKAANPDILIIALGTNDADPWRWNQYGKDFKDDYRAMIQEFRDGGSNPSLYFCLAPPKFPLTSDQNKVIENQLIPIVKELAEEYHARLIDYHTLLLDCRNLFPDDLHPSDAGATLMAQKAKEVIAETQTLSVNIEVSEGSVDDERVAVVTSGGNVTVTPSATDGTWIWEGPNGFTSTERILSLKEVSSGGVYTVRHTDEDGYMTVDKVVVCIQGQKNTAITQWYTVGNGGTKKGATVTVRPGEKFSLNPSSSGMGTVVGWSWSGPNGYFSSEQKASFNIAYEGGAGTYTVTVTNANGRQCSAEYNVVVEGERICPNLVPYVDYGGWKQASEIAVPVGSSVKFGPQPTTGGSWVWTGPGGYESVGREAIVKNINASTAGDYVGTYTNEAGCEETVIITIRIECPELVPYIFTDDWQKTTECVVKEGETIRFGPQPVSGKWSWTGPNGFTSNLRDPYVNNVSADAVGQYIATRKDDNGCEDHLVFDIQLEGSDGIDAVTGGGNLQNGTLYDLQGRPVKKQHVKGSIYLQNDKKVVVE